MEGPTCDSGKGSTVARPGRGFCRTVVISARQAIPLMTNSDLPYSPLGVEVNS